MNPMDEDTPCDESYRHYNKETGGYEKYELHVPKNTIVLKLSI